MTIVTGILPTTDPREIEAALTSANVEIARVRVITRDAPSQASEESVMEFVHAAESQAVGDFTSDITRGTGFMSDSGGTSVPGIGGRGPSLGEFSHGSGLGYLTGFPIPQDQIDNYNDAVAAGRSVITMEVDGDPAPIVAAFKAAGLRVVRVF